MPSAIGPTLLSIILVAMCIWSAFLAGSCFALADGKTAIKRTGYFRLGWAILLGGLIVSRFYG